LLSVVAGDGASVLGVGVLEGIVGFVVIFAENRLGYDIFFGGPVSQVAIATACTAEGEVVI